MVNLDKLYQTLSNNRTAEAQADPYAIVELLKLYEVQKYLSVTNHTWAGFNLIANLKSWQRFPSDIQEVVEVMWPSTPRHRE